MAGFAGSLPKLRIPGIGWNLKTVPGVDTENEQFLFGNLPETMALQAARSREQENNPPYL